MRNSTVKIGPETMMPRARPMRMMRQPVEYLNPGALETWFWGFCIFMLTAPFLYNISGVDPQIGVLRNLATMSPGVAGSALASYEIRFGIMAVAIVAAARFIGPYLNDAWRLTPLLLFVGWTMLSALWTDAFMTTMAASTMLACLTAAAFCMAVRLPPRYFTRAVFYSGIWMAGFSILWAVALPKYGVHQTGDATQAVHAGAWRGVYIHKNVLGQLAAAYVALAICCGRDVIPALWARIALAATMLFLIARSDSAAAPLIAVLAPLLAWVAVCLNGEKRMVASWLMLPLVVGALFCAPYILELMGRDMTFTGRTKIWDLAPHSIAGSPFVGYGFASPTYGDFAYRVHERVGVFDAHNGFLELTLGVGLIGVLLFLNLLYALWRKARIMHVMGGSYRAHAFAAAAVLMALLIGNMSESNMKAMGAIFSLGFVMSAGLLFYRLPIKVVMRQPVDPGPRPRGRQIAQAWRHVRGATPAE